MPRSPSLSLSLLLHILLTIPECSHTGYITRISYWCRTFFWCTNCIVASLTHVVLLCSSYIRPANTSVFCYFPHGQSWDMV
ncbi:hypothetical protein BDZ94DRAFT_1247350 [Collybia nuda]|uniref:Secreted protein n=1 Tax=Collybia nuda TaxID=64659 RepID=A0A9P5YGI5_9AGAR|nr:hypothetical protein BDZ94DRAFT_1247350 [Collybia nuda]